MGRVAREKQRANGREERGAHYSYLGTMRGSRRNVTAPRRTEERERDEDLGLVSRARPAPPAMQRRIREEGLKGDSGWDARWEARRNRKTRRDERVTGCVERAGRRHTIYKNVIVRSRVCIEWSSSGDNANSLGSNSTEMHRRSLSNPRDFAKLKIQRDFKNWKYCERRLFSQRSEAVNLYY